jgi:nucleoside-diphosphate-sugar epimerase
MVDDDIDEALQGVEAVVHLAAITDAEGSFDKSEDVNLINFEGTQKIIQACIRNGVRRLIFPSTTSVYGPISGIALEDSSRSDLRPQSPYAVSKLAAEDEILRYTNDGDIEGVVLRLGTIFGPSPGMRFHTAVNKFIFHAVTDKPLTVWEDAVDLVRPYLDLQDAVRVIGFMLTNSQCHGNIYNVVTLNATLDQIIESIRLNIEDINIEYTSTRMLNQVSYHVNDDKLRGVGFKYCGDLNTGIRDTYNILRGINVSRNNR